MVKRRRQRKRVRYDFKCYDDYQIYDKNSNVQHVENNVEKSDNTFVKRKSDHIETGTVQGRRRPRGRGIYSNSVYSPNYGYSKRGGEAGQSYPTTPERASTHKNINISAEKQDTIENEVSESSLEFYASRLKYFSDEW